MLFQTLILQSEVGFLTVGKFIVIIQTDTLGHTIVVGAVVGDVQFAVAIDKRQVTIAIETTHVLRTDSH